MIKLIMETKSLFFVGLSKNCFETLKKNIAFLQQFKAESKYKIYIFIIDSDSDDGTKQYCIKLKKDKIIDEFIELDHLSVNYESRIKRLVICRNEGLKQIKLNFKEPSLFLPMDMDMDLFKFMDNSKFNNIIKYFLNSEIEALFPFSIPYYYDIFALRKKGWVQRNNVNKAEILKRTLIIGSFIYNYFFIIRKQYSPNKFNAELINVDSAFGGMAIYKIAKPELLDQTYSWDEKNSASVCEHIFFNNLFDKKYILKNWKVEAPVGHIIFKSLNVPDKFLYILRTIKYDLKNLKIKILG